MALYRCKYLQMLTELGKIVLSFTVLVLVLSLALMIIDTALCWMGLAILPFGCWS